MEPHPSSGPLEIIRRTVKIMDYNSIYTIEERVLLTHILKKTHRDMQDSLKKAGQYTGVLGTLGHQTLIGEIAWDINRMLSISKALSTYMTVPYDQLPLYINDTDRCIRAIVLWRLQVGK